MIQSLARMRSCTVLLLSILVLSTRVAAQDEQDSSGPNIVAIQCQGCHRPIFESFAGNPHSVLEEADWIERSGETVACRNCHGDVTEHIEQRGRGPVFAFRTETELAQADRCLGCHRSDHPDFERSPHAQAGLTCTDCHSNHDGQPHRTALLRETEGGIGQSRGLDRQSALCSGCHGEILAQFELNERHRLRENVLACTSCHNPHEPASRMNLGGFQQAVCADCHADKHGPFVFEHQASRTEGCTACHSPHGSPNRHMLASSRVAEVCYSCHAAVPQFHTGFSPAGPPRFNLDTQCTNCHSSIHGSNFDPVFLR